MNELNSILASAFDPRKSIFDNVTAVLTLYLSTWLLSSHYDRVCCSLSLSSLQYPTHGIHVTRMVSQEIARFDKALEEANAKLYNPAGLNLLNPRKNSFLFVRPSLCL